MTGRHPRSGAARVGRICAVGAVALLVFHLLRTWVAERYLVPTESMEPTLHGDRLRGDLVLVDKLGLFRSHAVASLHRFDLVVVRDPDTPDGHLVKRLASAGDEELAIQDGDLFARPLGATSGFVRIQKQPIDHGDMRVTFYEYPREGAVRPGEYLSFDVVEGGTEIAVPFGAAQPEHLGEPYEQEQRRRAAGGTPAGWRPPPHALRTTTPIDVSFLDTDGRRIAVGRGFDRDVGIEIGLAFHDAISGVCFALEHGERMSCVTYARDGLARLRTGVEAVTEARGPALAGDHVDFAFGYLDGRLFLVVDGQLVLLHDAIESGDEPDGWPENALHFAVGGDGAPARITRVRLFHDVVYRADAIAFAAPRYRVEPDSVFLLGDNSAYSVDSRRRGAFPVSVLAGRPLAVIGPTRRIRWLPR